MPRTTLIPTDLQPTTRRWAEHVFSNFRFVPDSTEHRLLVEAARALDRADEARLILNRDGLTVLNARNQVVTHPAVAIERDSRALFARLVSAIGVDHEQVAPGA